MSIIEKLLVGAIGIYFASMAFLVYQDIQEKQHMQELIQISGIEWKVSKLITDLKNAETAESDNIITADISPIIMAADIIYPIKDDENDIKSMVTQVFLNDLLLIYWNVQAKNFSNLDTMIEVVERDYNLYKHQVIEYR